MKEKGTIPSSDLTMALLDMHTTQSWIFYLLTFAENGSYQSLTIINTYLLIPGSLHIDNRHRRHSVLSRRGTIYP